MGNCLVQQLGLQARKKQDDVGIKKKFSPVNNNNHHDDDDDDDRDEDASGFLLIHDDGGEDEEKKKIQLISAKRPITTTSKNLAVLKILILGTGESGKSTLIKQMKIIHQDGYSPEEMLEFRPIILDNLVSSMKYVVTGMRLLNIPFQYGTNKDVARDLIMSEKYFDDYHVLFPHLQYGLKTLWQDNGVREAVARGFEYELNDSALYYFENMDRITGEKYVPNTTDVVKSRIRTIGVVETEFKINNQIIRMYDVGGQRSERRKWIQCFEDVRTLLFVVAISEYDMTLVEDCTRNRLRESLLLFGNIVNNVFFRNTTTILFLNKFDLFREKILFTERQLRYFFDDYRGPDYDPEKASMFVENLFQRIAFRANPGKLLHTHFTTATDTGQITIVFNSIVDVILRDNLRHSTLL